MDSAGPVGCSSQSRLAEVVETHVLVLFLDPVDFGILVFLELGDDKIVWEWSDLIEQVAMDLSKLKIPVQLEQ